MLNMQDSTLHLRRPGHVLPQPTLTLQDRWQREAAFFDAEEYAEGAIAPETVNRYVNLPEPWTPSEVPFFLLGDIRNRRILEVGCGDGDNAILLAMKGATVVGLDVSPRAIEIARKKAALHNVSDRVQFECVPLEVFAGRNSDSFDIICGWAILHHVLPLSDAFLENLKQLGTPDARFLFVEPVSMWRWLRKLRLTLPIPVHGTEDERPLEPADLNALDRHLPNLNRRYFGFLERAALLMLDSYERAGWRRKNLYRLAVQIDRLVLDALRISGLASRVVVFTR